MFTLFCEGAICIVRRAAGVDYLVRAYGHCLGKKSMAGRWNCGATWLARMPVLVPSRIGSIPTPHRIIQSNIIFDLLETENQLAVAAEQYEPPQKLETMSCMGYSRLHPITTNVKCE